MMEDIMEKHDIIKKQLVFVEDYCHGDKSEALVNLRVLIRSHLNTDASSTINETAYCRHSKISESCLECQKLVMDKKVKDRSQQQHLFLIKNKFNGSVRDYLLSMGAFKDVNIDDAEDSVIEEKIDAHTKVSMEAYDQGINDLLNMIEMHYFKGDHYYQEVKELANVLRHDAEDSLNESNHSQQPLKLNINVKTKSYEVEKDGFSPTETGAIISVGVEDQQPNSNLSPVDTKSAPRTMHEEYGDGSDHEVCKDCGWCKFCGDCEKYGCIDDSVCECGHHTNHHSHPYPMKKDNDDLECDVDFCDCKKFRDSSLCECGHKECANSKCGHKEHYHDLWELSKKFRPNECGVEGCDCKKFEKDALSETEDSE